MKYLVAFRAALRLVQSPKLFEGMVMQVSLLIVLLQDFEALVQTIGCSSRADDVREFRRLLEGQEGTTLGQLTGKLAKGRSVSQIGAVSTPVRALRSTFAKLQALLLSANAKKAADDIAALARVLDGCNHPNIHQFVEEAKGWLANPSKRKPSPSKESKKGTSSGDDVRAELVRDYVRALSQTSEDNSAFDQTISEMQANKRVRAPEMREIAKLYLGYEIAKTKGRADALRAIVDRQALSARQDARGRTLDRLKSW
jgi:hypothetical protein